MPHTYSQITAHLVFSTKERRRLMTDVLRRRLYPYLAALINNDFGFARAIGGTRDHIHLLADVRTGVCVSDLVRSVKSISSGWIRRNVPRQRGFAWQWGGADLETPPTGAGCFGCPRARRLRAGLRLMRPLARA